MMNPRYSHRVALIRAERYRRRQLEMDREAERLERMTRDETIIGVVFAVIVIVVVTIGLFA